MSWPLHCMKYVDLVEQQSRTARLCVLMVLWYTMSCSSRSFDTFVKSQLSNSKMQHQYIGFSQRALSCFVNAVCAFCCKTPCCVLKCRTKQKHVALLTCMHCSAAGAITAGASAQALFDIRPTTDNHCQQHVLLFALLVIAKIAVWRNHRPLRRYHKHARYKHVSPAVCG